ncbi:helix-turn-helix domain-containing protein [Isoptericola sp. NPDC057191]|uniref:helix-turn-helix domain-containing protein n=1 Tax=Isoptericola sp. NPDC057191 TaxID=3346041 RepID=UPI00362B9BC6
MSTHPPTPTGTALDDLFSDCGKRLSAGDVAQLLGMTHQGVLTWLRTGVIPGYKLGGTWFVMRDELKAAMYAGMNHSAGGYAS